MSKGILITQWVVAEGTFRLVETATSYLVEKADQDALGGDRWITVDTIHGSDTRLLRLVGALKAAAKHIQEASVAGLREEPQAIDWTTIDCKLRALGYNVHLEERTYNNKRTITSKTILGSSVVLVHSGDGKIVMRIAHDGGLVFLLNTAPDEFVRLMQALALVRLQ